MSNHESFVLACTGCGRLQPDHLTFPFSAESIVLACRACGANKLFGMTNELFLSIRNLKGEDKLREVFLRIDSVLKEIQAEFDRDLNLRERGIRKNVALVRQTTKEIPIYGVNLGLLFSL